MPLKSTPANKKNEDAALLGIESGGTRTVALLAAGGSEPVQAEFGPANLRLMKDENLVQRFKEIRASLPKRTLKGIAVGMAGARAETDRQRIRSAASTVWPGIPCYATNDLETALAAASTNSALGLQTRVLILSGTGSCCFGRDGNGKTLRFGGWGHLLGDSGSGYDIGLRALRSVVYHLDCEGKWSLLGQDILRSLQLNDPESLIDWTKAADKTAISALAVNVFETAAKGDNLAAEILSQAACSLARDGADCARQLAGNQVPVQFILAGGLLQKQPGFARQVRAQLQKLWPKGTVTTLERSGVWGAIELAKTHFASAGDLKIPDRETQVATKSKDSVPLPISLDLSPTERRNPHSLNLDRMPLAEAIELMVHEDAGIPLALLKETKNIERAVSLIVGAFKKGGRLFYVGAGSSGRLGVLDSSEIPPTFRAKPELVQGIIAGGYTALWKSVEGAEDNAAAGAETIKFRGITRRDVVVGIAASGRTPFVWGALNAAKKCGAATIILCFNPNIQIPRAGRPNVVITPEVGPEVLTGSTRLKAGTATKMVLNILTTLSMVRMGKVMSNLMVDLNASNDKLRERAVRIVQEITGADANAAKAALEKSAWIVKSACQRLK